MKTKNLIFTALLTAAALVAFVIESAMPPLTPIYGIKLGLSNVFTLFAFYALGKKEAFMVLFVRVILGNIITGQIMSFAYSMVGGLLSLLTMVLLSKVTSNKQIWAVSAISAVAHNIGQITVAIVVTSTVQIVFYLPILIISGIITGIFTGLCAQFLLFRLDKLGFIRLKNKTNE